MAELVNPYSGKFSDALAYAQALHGQQRRKGAGDKQISYITHLLAVSAMVGEQGGCENEVVAALLHDTVEDHDRGGQTAFDIEAMFGNDVLELVLGCTNQFDDKAIPMRLTKVPYIKHIERASTGVHRIAISDKIHNARSTVMNLRAEGGEAVWKRFRGGREDTLWYYRSLAEMFERVYPGEYSKELTATVYIMHSLA